MIVKRKIPAYKIQGTSEERRRQIVQAEIRHMGPCARLRSWDGVSLLRDETDDYALHFDVPDDPSFLLV